MPFASGRRADRRRRPIARRRSRCAPPDCGFRAAGRNAPCVSRVPCGRVKDASPSGSPRPVTALTTPARGPSTPLKMRAVRPLRSPAVWSSASAASSRSGRSMTTLPEEPASLARASAKRRPFAIVEAVGEPHDAVIRLAAKLALAASRRAPCGQARKAAGPSPAARSRACSAESGPISGSPGAVGASTTVLPSRMARSMAASMASRRSGQWEADAQPLSTTSRSGPVPAKLSPVGIEHGTGERQHDQGGKQHAERRQPPGTMRRRLLGRFQVLQEPRRREHDDGAGLAASAATATRSRAAPRAPSRIQGWRKPMAPSVIMAAARIGRAHGNGRRRTKAIIALEACKAIVDGEHDLFGRTVGVMDEEGPAQAPCLGGKSVAVALSAAPGSARAKSRRGRRSRGRGLRSRRIRCGPHKAASPRPDRGSARDGRARLAPRSPRCARRSPRPARGNR